LTLHKFRIGQLVDLAPGKRGMPASGRPYAIIRLLPPQDGQNQYRIKGQAETFERIAKESELTGRI
jgi:hypothetical protein